ncbi:MAG: hypothetical protein QM635_04235 [Microbacteriaceae bacterium]
MTIDDPAGEAARLALRPGLAAQQLALEGACHGLDLALASLPAASDSVWAGTARSAYDDVLDRLRDALAAARVAAGQSLTATAATRAWADGGGEQGEEGVRR